MKLNTQTKNADAISEVPLIVLLPLSCKDFSFAIHQQSQNTKKKKKKKRITKKGGGNRKNQPLVKPEALERSSGEQDSRSTQHLTLSGSLIIKSLLIEFSECHRLNLRLRRPTPPSRSLPSSSPSFKFLSSSLFMLVWFRVPAPPSIGYSNTCSKIPLYLYTQTTYSTTQSN